MSLRYLEDLALLSQNKPTGLEGVESVVKFVKDSTPEVNNLLKNECDVIFECRYCRSMFRSIANFVTHKRTFCRGMHQTAISNVQAARKAVEEEIEKLEKESKEREKEGPKRNPTHLRRTNIVGALNKKATDVDVPVPGTTEQLVLHTLPRVSKDVPVTVFEDGVQKVLDIPPTLAQKEAVPDDRIVLVMPQDQSSKYREMQLRRRDGQNKQESVRTVTSSDTVCLERCSKYAPHLPDSGSLRCLHEDCASIRPFGSVQSLMYHIAIKHIQRHGPEGDHANKIPCLLCNWHIKSWSRYHKHLAKAHRQTKAAHEEFRSKEAENEKKRPGRKSQVARHRSLSPDVDGADLDEKEEEEEQEVEESEQPPVISQEVTEDQSVMKNEEDDEDDPEWQDGPPRLTRIGRGRREIKVPKKYLETSPALSGSSGSNKKKSPPSSGEKVTPKSTPQVSRDPSPAVERTKSPSEEPAETEKDNEEKIAARLEKKRLNDVQRSLEFIVKKTSIGELNATLEDLSSREPSNTPPPTIAPITEAAEIPPEERSVEPDVLQKQVVEALKTDVKPKAKSYIAKKRKRIMDLFAKRAKEAGAQETQENYTKPDKKRCKPAESSSESEESDDSSSASENENEEGGAPIVRPSRNRKRPDWMDKDFIIGKSDKSKRARRDESSPVTTEQVTSNAARRHSAGPTTQTQISTPVFPTKLLTGSFTIPKKRKAALNVSGSPAKNSDSPSKRKEKEKGATPENGAPTLVAREEFVVPLQKPGTSSEDNFSPAQKKIPLDTDQPYTPRALRFLDMKKDSAPDSPSKSRRKQNISAARDNDNGVRMISKNGRPQSYDGDLGSVPVYLSHTQKRLFFSALIAKPQTSITTGDQATHYCNYCKIDFPNLKEGRRHMVSHIRVMRLRCALCGAGAFFCTDMRAHLMEGFCQKLDQAPKSILRPGYPKFTRDDADTLIEVVDKSHPGRVMYTSGPIVSATSFVPYFPDPVIEERILGCNRVVGRSTVDRQAAP